MNGKSEILTENLSDGVLVSRIASGQYEYLDILISRYMPLILKTSAAYEGSGADSEDLIEEGILAVFSAVKAFDGTKASFSAFAALCIKRAMSSHIRTVSAGKRIPDRLVSSLDEVDISSPDTPEQLYIQKESLQSLKESIRFSLTELEYSVLCAYLEGFTHQQIAARLDISLKSVDNALSRIRKKLKDRQGGF